MHFTSTYLFKKSVDGTVAVIPKPPFCNQFYRSLFFWYAQSTKSPSFFRGNKIDSKNLIGLSSPSNLWHPSNDKKEGS